ncbi:MAG: hypothetical protein RIS35_2460 [Pseudomonadota bacterium]|jgi:hypothetical protein
MKEATQVNVSHEGKVYACRVRPLNPSALGYPRHGVTFALHNDDRVYTVEVTHGLPVSSWIVCHAWYIDDAGTKRVVNEQRAFRKHALLSAIARIALDTTKARA